MQFLSGGYLARWNLRNQEGFFSQIPSASDTTDNMESKKISQIHPLSSNVDCIFDRNTHIYISYPIFGDDDKLVLCHFSKCLYQHRSIEVTKFFLRRPKALDQSEGTFVWPTSSSHINDMRSFPFTCLSNSIHWVWSWLICFKAVNSRGAKGEQN